MNCTEDVFSGSDPRETDTVVVRARAGAEDDAEAEIVGGVGWRAVRDRSRHDRQAAVAAEWLEQTANGISHRDDQSNLARGIDGRRAIENAREREPRDLNRSVRRGLAR